MDGVSTEEAAGLAESQTVAVVGLSSQPDRGSYRVAAYLQKQGYRIIPVNPWKPIPILGEPVYPDLGSVPVSIDVVDAFRRSEHTDVVIDGAIAAGARAVWPQVGITNAAGLERARDAGLRAIQDRCMMVAHRHWRAAALGSA